jgi:glycosyltransferase involved in cell wall biosynthesis
MRIAYVCADPGVPAFGRKGCSIHLQEVIRAFIGLGARVELFATRCDGEAPLDLGSVPVHRLPVPGKGDLAERERAALSANRDLLSALRRAGPFDLVYERYSLWSYAGMEYAEASGTRSVLEVNAPLIEEQAEHRGLADRASAEIVAARAFGAASALLAVSSEVAAYLKGYPSSRGRVQVIPNGVNAALYPPDMRPSLSAASGDFTVGFVGSLKPWHGLPTLVEAFDVLHQLDSSARLLIVGDGTERDRLEADLTARGLLQVSQLTGGVDPREVPGLLASMDVAVAPYPNHARCYFSPLKVFEYMAAGLPVVASRIGQLVELIQDGINGLLCPPGDPVALACAIGRVRSEPELSARMRREARALVLEHHTWDAVARRILRLADITPVRRTPYLQNGPQIPLYGARPLALGRTGASMARAT